MLNHKDQDHVEMILKYIEDGDLRKWNLPDTKAFNLGLHEWRSKLNCISNSGLYEQVEAESNLHYLHTITFLNSTPEGFFK